MLAAALEIEVDDDLAAHAAERDERGRRLVVRHGHARQRQVTTVAGAVAVRAPELTIAASTHRPAGGPGDPAAVEGTKKVTSGRSRPVPPGRATAAPSLAVSGAAASWKQPVSWRARKDHQRRCPR
jgi:hypothetical protein